jgi:ASC-1-like (ASCH) protein
MADLHLNLKSVYFDEIKAGTKKYEYRLKSKWEQRLFGRIFDRILIKRGYPASDDLSRILVRPWQGYETLEITHPHFGPDPVEVLAIKVND